MRSIALGKALALIAVAVLVFGACSSPAASNAPASQAAPGSAPASGGATGTIKIGGGFALTGGESALDLPAAHGAQLAVKEINAAGGINGQQIELITHDSKYDMTVTAQVAKQYVEQDKVPVFLGYTDSDSVIASGRVFHGSLSWPRS